MIGQIILNALFIVMAVAVIIPFIILVSVSLSNETDISYFGYRLIPKQIDLTAYRYVFKHPKGYGNFLVCFNDIKYGGNIAVRLSAFEKDF